MINFKKDLLLIDLETTGLDASKHEIIQLAAVLLDRRTLKEKKAFNAYCRPKKWQNRDRESMRINRITLEQVRRAPSLNETLKKFSREFNPKQVILSYYGGPLDMDFLRKAYRRAKIEWKFDYHFFNLWGVFFTYLAANNRLKNKKKFSGFALEDLMKKFKIKSLRRHDGLEDCRIEAEILRKVLHAKRI